MQIMHKIYTYCRNKQKYDILEIKIRRELRKIWEISRIMRNMWNFTSHFTCNSFKNIKIHTLYNTIYYLYILYNTIHILYNIIHILYNTIHISYSNNLLNKRIEYMNSVIWYMKIIIINK